MSKEENSQGILQESELILNPDGSLYHIHLKAEHVSDTVLLVGDQGRVQQISRHFDKVEHKISNREFFTHVGEYKGKRITVMSTGIGTDNIDIAINELDAAVNIDLDKRRVKDKRKSLNLIRIGTSGALHPDIAVGSFCISEFGLGFDGLIHYYNYNPSGLESEIQERILNHLNWNPQLSEPYLIQSAPELFNQLKDGMVAGITATAAGFYGPQGRELQLKPKTDNINEKLSSFSYKDYRISNFEMETSALFGLGKLLGHQCCTSCAIIANRTIKSYAKDYKKIVDQLIEVILHRI